MSEEKLESRKRPILDQDSFRIGVEPVDPANTSDQWSDPQISFNDLDLSIETRAEVQKNELRSAGGSKQAGSYQASVRVRCPGCLKLFSIAQNSVSSNRPRFQCSSCQKKFWVPFPQVLGEPEMIGFPVEWLTDPDRVSRSPDKEPGRVESPERVAVPQGEGPESRIKETASLTQGFRDCPKCQMQNSRKSKECLSCGLVFSKFKAPEALEFDGVERSLKAFWTEVITDYENVDQHELFFSRAQNHNDLGFLCAKYKERLSLDPFDEIAQRMLERAQMLVTLPTVDLDRPTPFQKIIRSFGASGVFILIGLSLVLFGYFAPMFRNFAGLGAALTFLALFIRLYLRTN